MHMHIRDGDNRTRGQGKKKEGRSNTCDERVFKIRRRISARYVGTLEPVVVGDSCYTLLDRTWVVAGRFVDGSDPPAAEAQV